MGRGKRRGEVIVMMMMIVASKMAEVSTMKMLTTKGGAKEYDEVCHPAAALPYSLVLLLLVCLTPCHYHCGGVGSGVEGGAVGDDNDHQHGGGHQHQRLMLTAM
jgi:hypothetical protein